MNSNSNPTIKNFFKTLDAVFFALLSGQIIYFIVGLLIVQSGNITGFGGLNTIFMFITPVVVLTSIFASKFIYNKQVTEFDKSLSLENKMASFRIANIIKLALLEGANIITVSIMIITANYFFAALFVVVIVLVFFNKPSKEKFIIEYEISADDALKLLS
ncbi:MAG: hypothetical protein MUF28_00070 [Ignavibacterium sp.]|jgi:hypothetical protein|nr:hypothetical protein [Ignavibacterium sp.]